MPRQHFARVPVAGVETGFSLHFQYLQASAGCQFTRFVRDEAVQEPVTPVLRFVDDPGIGIDGDRFVHEASHGFQGNGGNQPDFAGGRHFEVVAVVPGVESFLLLNRLLAGDPAPPGSRSSRAVANRSAQAQEVLFQAHLASVVDHVGGSPKAGPPPSTGIVQFFSVRGREQLVDGAKGSDGLVIDAQLVIPDQDGAPCRTGEGSHPVMQTRNSVAVVHQLSHLGQDPIGEARGEFDDSFRVGLQISITGGSLGFGKGLRQPLAGKRAKSQKAHGAGPGHLQKRSS